MENATRITFFLVLYSLSTAQLNFTLMKLLMNQMYLQSQKTHRIFHVRHCEKCPIRSSFGLNFPVLGQFLRSAAQTNRTSNYGKRI